MGLLGFWVFFLSINIFVLWLLNIYPLCPPARSPNLSQKTDLKKGRKGQERTILFEPCSQFPGDFCLFSRFSCAAAGRWDAYIILHRQKNWLLSLPLLQTWADSRCNSQLQTPSRPVPAGECQTVRCTALHPLTALHFKQSLRLFLYTPCDRKATEPKPFPSLITICFSFFW